MTTEWRIPSYAPCGVDKSFIEVKNKSQRHLLARGDLESKAPQIVFFYRIEGFRGKWLWKWEITDTHTNTHIPDHYYYSNDFDQTTHLFQTNLHRREEGIGTTGLAVLLFGQENVQN